MTNGEGRQKIKVIRQLTTWSVGVDFIKLPAKVQYSKKPGVCCQFPSAFPSGKLGEIKRLLDAGFYNFLVPFVENVEQARRAVAATRYPPQGIRGVSVAQRSNRYGTVPDYFKSINDQISVMVQIESRAGVAAAREIAALDGIDGIFVGPSDLAAGLGHLGNAGHPDVQAAIAAVFADAKACGKPTGVLASVEADARRYMGMGATFVAVGSDLGLFRVATQALCDRYRS